MCRHAVGGEAGHDPFVGERVEHVEQEFTCGRRGVHALRERPKGDLALAQGGDDGQQVRQRATEPVELPDDQHVAGLHEVQRLGQAGPVVRGAGGSVFKQVTRVALQVGGLAIVVGGHTHVADEHVRKTPGLVFAYGTS